MINVVLLERYNYGENLAEAFLNYEDVHVRVLCVGNEIEKNYYRNNSRVDIVLSRDSGEIYNTEAIESIVYDEIRKYKNIQSDFESGMGRFVHDYHMVKFLYYRSLSYWINVFSNNSINLVVVKADIHGMADDIIPLEIAKQKGIPCFLISTSGNGMFALKCYNSGEFVKNRKNIPIQIDNAKYYKWDFNGTSNNKFFWKSLIKAFIYKIGGATLENCISDILHLKFTHQYMGMYGSEYTTFDYVRSFFKYKYVETKLRKMLVKPDYSQNYIVLYLHLEPEATIQIKPLIQTQLLAIKMLAKALPPNWVLYVKEHRAQYMLNRREAFYYMLSRNKYKTVRFYKEIANSRNVKLIDMDCPAAELMDNAKAVATFSGTIALEASDKRVPVLLFDSENTVYQYHKDYICIRSYYDLISGLERVCSGWRPEYKNLKELFENYVVEADQDGFKRITENIMTIIRGI